MITLPPGLWSLEKGTRVEWVEPDGRGGFAMGNACLHPTRRYHALLTVARRDPGDRRVLLQGFEERLRAGGSESRLDSSERRDGPGPDGHRSLAEVACDPFPRFTYRVGPHVLERTVAGLRDPAGTVVRWVHRSGPGPLVLELAPLLACRSYHDLQAANGLADPAPVEARGGLCFRPYPEEPPFWLHAPGARFVPAPRWVPGFVYRTDRERGYPFVEDLLVPGTYSIELPPGTAFHLLASGRDLDRPEPAALLGAEGARRAGLAAAGSADGPLGPLLALAADRFRIRRPDGRPSVLAGFPWFEEWGRDAMVSLAGLEPGAEPGFALGTLGAFAAHERGGLLPNRFGDPAGGPLWNAADAPLLFVLELERVARATPGAPALSPLWDCAFRIFDAFRAGTRHGIGIDPADGLLVADDPLHPLTWMDARIGSRAVTPRRGKPVELQVLWLNAAGAVGREADRRGDRDRGRAAREAVARVETAFPARFWSPERGWLADHLGPGGAVDAALRPNQVLALALPQVPLPAAAARAALDAVDRELLTSVGLRTLAPSHPEYRGRYHGDVLARDEAYHQGTVWPWLLGPYGRACLRFRGRGERRRLAALLEPLLGTLAREGMGSLPEVYDGDPPHRPGGCPAQAWSVAQVAGLARTLARPAAEPP